MQSRKDALKNGSKRYFTGACCQRGHIAERDTVTGACCDCAKTRRQRYQQKVRDALLHDSHNWPIYSNRTHKKNFDLLDRVFVVLNTTSNDKAIEMLNTYVKSLAFM